MNQLYEMMYSVVYYGSMISLLGVGGISLTLYYFQNKILYLPQIGNLPRSPRNNPFGYNDPSNVQILFNSNIPFKKVQINTKDGIILYGWFCEQQHPRENAGNIGTRIPFLRQYYQRVGCNLIIVAYRGYSDSTGEPSQQGIQIDAIAIARYVINLPNIDHNKIIFHGRSLGGAVATYAASHSQIKDKIRGLILQNTFTSISQLVNVVFKYISPLKYFILCNHWPTKQRIGKITASVHFIKCSYILQAMRDELIPVRMMNQLQGIAIKNNLKVSNLQIPQGTHNQSYNLNPQRYFDSINKFIKQL